MAFSAADKAIAESAYQRTKPGYRNGIAGGFMGGLIGAGQPLFQVLRDPHTSHRALIIFSALSGILFAGCIVTSIFLSRQRKRDLELVRFFEKHFPEECSWKQEEKILAEVEDLRLKAKVDSLIHQQAH